MKNILLIIALLSSFLFANETNSTLKKNVDREVAELKVSIEEAKKRRAISKKEISKRVKEEAKKTPKQSSNQKGPVKKISKEEYDNLVTMLTSTKESAEIEGLKKSELKRIKEEEKIEEERSKDEKNIEKMLLPIPLKSIKLGAKTIVFAEYVEKQIEKLSVKQKPSIKNKSVVPQAQNIKLLKRVIKLSKGDQFKEWTINDLDFNFVEYHNLNTDEKIKKYF